MSKSKPKFRAVFFKDIGLFFRICFELWRGFHFLRHTRRAVSIFGSARLLESHPYCKLAHDTAQEFAKRGFSIITGGGPGIMKAANRAAYEMGAPSIGVNIKLPYEQTINPFVTASLKCRYFFVRKVLLARYSEVYLIFPGGFGTLDEFFELITLLQTNKMRERPVILVGRKFWNDLVKWCKNELMPEGMIKESELNRIRIADTPEEVLELLPKNFFKN